MSGLSQSALRAHALLCRQRLVPAHEHAPDVPLRQRQRLVLRRVHGAEDEAEVYEPAVELLRHIGRVSAGDVVVHVRAALLQRPGRLRQQAQRLRLPRAMCTSPATAPSESETSLSALRTSSSISSARLRRIMPSSVSSTAPGAARAADKQPLAQLLLQRLQLCRERRLREVQRLRRRGYALLPRHRQKILQYPQLHVIASTPSLSGRGIGFNYAQPFLISICYFPAPRPIL